LRELKDGTKIIAIDHGYGNIKTVNTVTPTGLVACKTELIFTGNILEYENTFYRIGEGHKEFMPDKASDDDYYILTLMAIAKEMNLHGLQEADIHLVAGLPLTWIKTQREVFRAYLLRNEEVRFTFNGNEYHVHFMGCSLYPQGYPAIIDRLGNFHMTNMLADIGNGTMNIMYIINKKAIESKCWTEKMGVNQCMIAAQNAVMDSFIEQLLRHGTSDIGKKYMDCICDVAKTYVDTLFATLRRYEYSPDLMRLYIVGGGGCLVKNFGQYDAERVTIIDDICATAKGYEYLAYAALQRKSNP
jgi:plasmid segregation protein ParM